MKILVTQGVWKCHPSLNRLNFLRETGNVGYTDFQTKTAEMTLKIGQGHRRWHSLTSTYHFPLVV